MSLPLVACCNEESSQAGIVLRLRCRAQAHRRKFRLRPVRCLLRRIRSAFLECHHRPNRPDLYQ